MKAVIIIRTLFFKLISSLKRFPVTILFAAATVTVLIMLNHLEPNSSKQTREFLSHLAMALALGIPLTLCIKVLFERIPGLSKVLQAAVYFSVIVVLSLYYFFLLKDFSMVTISRYIAISISLYVTFAFIPYFYKKDDYELYVINLFTSFIITYLYSAILFAGLSAMLFTIDKLFSAGISGNVYEDIWLVVAGVFAPAFFLADIPEYGREIRVENYPKVLKILLLYIVMPMIVTYTAILYAYFVKIVVTRHWPDGIISNLVLWYSIISALVIFFVFQLRSSNHWVKVFVLYLPKFIIPLLVMMFVSMGIRINAYGITENRYFVILAGLWVSGIMIYYIWGHFLSGSEKLSSLTSRTVCPLSIIYKFCSKVC